MKIKNYMQKRLNMLVLRNGMTFKSIYPMAWQDLKSLFPLKCTVLDKLFNLSMF